MGLPLVSIIVPMYNSSKTILKCVNSLISQSYKNIEVLIIDDGSVDNSFSLVEKINDIRIKLFKQNNSGASTARNNGVEKSKGDYVLFVDSDDYIHLNMVEELIKYADEKTIVFSNTYVKEKSIEYELKLFKNNTDKIDKHRAMEEIISGGGGLVCSKLISKSIIDENNIRFKCDLVLGEDQVFFLELASCSEQFIYVDKAFYYYDRTSETSATNKYHENLIDNYLKLQQSIKELFLNEGYDSKEDYLLLNNKIKRWLRECIDNEIKGIKNNGFKKSFKNIKEIIEAVSEVVNFEYIEVYSFMDKIMINSLKRKDKLSVLNLMFFSKLLMIKNG